MVELLSRDCINCGQIVPLDPGPDNEAVRLADFTRSADGWIKTPAGLVCCDCCAILLPHQAGG